MRTCVYTADIHDSRSDRSDHIYHEFGVENHSSANSGQEPDFLIVHGSRLEKNRAFCGKSMKLGTHVHYTKTSKFRYSAKPDYAWGGCGGHFPKWPLMAAISETKRR